MKSPIFDKTGLLKHFVLHQDESVCKVVAESYHHMLWDIFLFYSYNFEVMTGFDAKEEALIISTLHALLGFVVLNEDSSERIGGKARDSSFLGKGKTII